MSFTMKTLTEGIRQRHMGAQHQRLTEKWNRTGLLRGLTGYNRENMSVMLENQAAQLLREANTLGGGNAGTTGGDIRGFSNVAFPIVRRVFGGLVANELVSIQPMSLPSGLLFYLDYTYGNNVGGLDRDGIEGKDIADSGDSALYGSGTSIYNNPTGKAIQSGSLGTGGQYDLLGSGYSRESGTQALAGGHAGAALPATTEIAFGAVDSDGKFTATASTVSGASSLTAGVGRLVDFDADLAQYLADNTSSTLIFACVLASDFTGTLVNADLTMLQDFALVADANDSYHVPASSTSLQGGHAVVSLRRHTKRVDILSLIHI